MTSDETATKARHARCSSGESHLADGWEDAVDAVDAVDVTRSA
jgi:hypothetical protein